MSRYKIIKNATEQVFPNQEFHFERIHWGEDSPFYISTYRNINYRFKPFFASLDQLKELESLTNEKVSICLDDEINDLTRSIIKIEINKSSK